MIGTLDGWQVFRSYWKSCEQNPNRRVVQPKPAPETLAGPVHEFGVFEKMGFQRQHLLVSPGPHCHRLSGFSLVMPSPPTHCFHPTSLKHLILFRRHLWGVSNNTTVILRVWGKVFTSQNEKRGKGVGEDIPRKIFVKLVLFCNVYDLPAFSFFLPF